MRRLILTLTLVIGTVFGLAAPAAAATATVTSGLVKVLLPYRTPSSCQASARTTSDGNDCGNLRFAPLTRSRNPLATLRPLIEPMTDPAALTHLNVHRHDQIGGLLHE
ncbi:hypothetical protein [Micromonospora rubida]